MFRILSLAQGTALYRRAGALWLARARRRMSFTVQVPFSAALGDSVFKEMPVAKFDPDASWQGKPLTRWTLTVRWMGDRKKTPAASLTYVRSGDGEWKEADSGVRFRYAGSGMDEALRHKASEILARPGR